MNRLLYFSVIVLFLTIVSCNESSKLAIKDNGIYDIGNENKDKEFVTKVDTIELWFPEKMERNVFDTLQIVSNDTFLIELINYSLESDVVFNYFNKDNKKYYVYHYRNIGSDLRILKNNSDFINERYTKRSFDTLFASDLLEIGTFDFAFEKVEDNALFFELRLMKPETDYVQYLKYYIDNAGEIKIEEYPEEYYEMY